jgi:hypothetical protein
LGGDFGSFFTVGTFVLRAGLVLNILGTIWGVGDSIYHGHGWQAAFRLTVGLLGMTQIRKMIGKVVPKVWRFPTPTGIAGTTVSQIEQVLVKSPVGRWAKDLATAIGGGIVLVDDAVQSGRFANARGKFSRLTNEIFLNVDKHSSVEEIAITYIHEAIHLFGIRGTAMSEVVARIGSGLAGDSLLHAARVAFFTIQQYGGKLPLLAVGEGGLMNSIFSMVDEESE